MDNEPIRESEFTNKETSGKKFSRRRFLKFAIPLSLEATGAALLLKKEADKLNRQKRELKKEPLFEKIEKDNAEKMFGYNPEDHGFKAFMQTESQNGKYIIHIGQHHQIDLQSESEEVIAQTVRVVCAVQNNIRSVLSVAKPNIVYLEAVTESGVKNLSIIRNVKEERFDPISPGPNQWKALAERYNVIQQNFEEHNISIPPSLNYSLHLNITRLSSQYPTLESRQTNQEEFTSNQEFVTSIDENATEFFPYEYQLGAAVRMFIEGDINIGPAETLKEHQEAVTASNNAENILDEEYIKEVVLDREKTAIDLISEQERDKDNKYIYLIYGNLHDFSDEVFDNQEGYGLIKFEPIIP